MHVGQKYKDGILQVHIQRIIILQQEIRDQCSTFQGHDATFSNQSSEGKAVCKNHTWKKHLLTHHRKLRKIFCVGTSFHCLIRSNSAGPLPFTKQNLPGKHRFVFQSRFVQEPFDLEVVEVGDPNVFHQPLVHQFLHGLS